ncbi:SelR-domain-containing protein [Massarina eburnea CBS 473.64]|uniref:Peptide-methionine (R)-S-oxide reductase n=1 Tax=Massarina eburnea CBS 473.64 TaxID=1395130 RepID=A0A6A6S1U7_9PLEO|nr:SelR-domain-containing protein [Massarina eburnea CBS 473.64]
MRFPSIPTLIRTFHTFTNTTIRAANPTFNISRLYNAPHRATFTQSMPIPFIGALFGTSGRMADNTNYPVQKTEGEWQAQLSPEQFRILRKKGTEMAGSGTYDKHYPDAGVYTCTACEAPLYKASHKFDSGCGWPAFWDAFPDAVGQRDDSSLGMKRTEIVCNNCGGHLGHIFKGERFGNPKNDRHCVNSVSINFSSEEKKE